MGRVPTTTTQDMPGRELVALKERVRQQERTISEIRQEMDARAERERMLWAAIQQIGTGMVELQRSQDNLGRFQAERMRAS
jgi:hypothetical protein